MRPSRLVSSRRCYVPRWHGGAHWEEVVGVDASRSLSDAFSHKESQDADVAFTDEGKTVVLEGVEVAPRSFDPVPVKESKDADHAFKDQGSVGGVEYVDVARSLSHAYPVKGLSWVANVRLQGKGHNPTGIGRANLPSIVGILQCRHASVSSRLVSPRLVSSMLCPTMARRRPLGTSRRRRCFPLIVRRLFAQGVAGCRCCLQGLGHNRCSRRSRSCPTIVRPRSRQGVEGGRPCLQGPSFSRRSRLC